MTSLFLETLSRFHCCTMHFVTIYNCSISRFTSCFNESYRWLSVNTQHHPRYKIQELNARQRLYFWFYICLLVAAGLRSDLNARLLGHVCTCSICKITRTLEKWWGSTHKKVIYRLVHLNYWHDATQSTMTYASLFLTTMLCWWS